MSEQKSYASLLVGSGFQGIVPLIILSSYYRGGWATAYCETGLAQWVFVFAWVGMGAVIYQFLINVWFWRINWKHYTTGGAAAVSETTRRKGRLDLSQLMIMCFNFIWFCSGQGMVWSTTGCAEEVYANITRGGWPGCATAGDAAGDAAGDERAEAEEGSPVTCELEPRPGCCYEPMHEFARVYSIFVFVLCGIITPCLLCAVCVQVCALRKARRSAGPHTVARLDPPFGDAHDLPQGAAALGTPGGQL